MSRHLYTWMIASLTLTMLSLTGCEPECEPAPEGSLGELTSWEQEFVLGDNLPSPPSIEYLEAEDGLELAYTDWIPDDWDGSGEIVLLVHGSSAYGELYGVLGERLAARGVLARLIDVRGHGRSRCAPPSQCGEDANPDQVEDDGSYWPGRPGDLADVNQITRDLHGHFEALATQWPEAGLWIAGHSSGGGVVSRYVEHVGMSHLEGAILLAPFNHPEQPQNDLGEWECGRVAGTPYAQVDVGALGDAMRSAPHRYVLSLHKTESQSAPLDTLRYSFTMMSGMAASDADDFHAAYVKPTLWIAGAEDALLDEQRSREEFERLPGGRAFVVMSETSHVGVTWSSTVGDVMADFIEDPEGAEDRVVSR